MLTGFERDAMIHAIGQTVEDYNNLLNQLNLPCVTKRSRSDFGFYLDFSSFISKLNDKRGVPLDGSFEAVAMHPNGEDAIFLYCLCERWVPVSAGVLLNRRVARR